MLQILQRLWVLLHLATSLSTYVLKVLPVLLARKGLYVRKVRTSLDLADVIDVNQRYNYYMMMSSVVCPVRCSYGYGTGSLCVDADLRTVQYCSYDDMCTVLSGRASPRCAPSITECVIGFDTTTAHVTPISRVGDLHHTGTKNFASTKNHIFIGTSEIQSTKIIILFSESSRLRLKSYCCSFLIERCNLDQFLTKAKKV